MSLLWFPPNATLAGALILVSVIFGLDAAFADQYWGAIAHLAVPFLLVHLERRIWPWAVVAVACLATLAAPYANGADTVTMENLFARMMIASVIVAIAIATELVCGRFAETVPTLPKTNERSGFFDAAALQTILDNIVEAVVIIDAEGRIVSFTPAAERMFGYCESDVIGRSIEMLMPEYTGHEHAGYMPRYQDTRDGRIIGEGFSEMIGCRNGGTEISVEMAINDVMINGQQFFIGTLRDISVRKRAEKELRDSESRFRHLAENIEDVFWVREEGEERPSYLSPAFERIWGCPSVADTAATGFDLFSQVHPTDIDRVILAKEKGVDSGFDVEYMIVRTDDEIRNIRERSFPVRDESGLLIRTVGVARDITAETSMQAYMIQMAKFAGLGRMLSGAVHELSQPLHVIRMAAEGASEILSSGDEDAAENVIRKLERIVGQTERVAAIVDKFRKLGNSKSITSTPTDLRAVIGTALSSVEARAEHSEIALGIEYPAECRQIRGDSEQLHQAFLNILTNACDAIESCAPATPFASHPHGISITVVDDIDSDHVIVHIENSGGVIPAADLSKVFDPFFTTREVGMGMGLGLSVTHAIVNEVDGRISVDNGEKGAIFSIYLMTVGDFHRHQAIPIQYGPVEAAKLI